MGPEDQADRFVRTECDYPFRDNSRLQQHGKGHLPIMGGCDQAFIIALRLENRGFSTSSTDRLAQHSGLVVKSAAGQEQHMFSVSIITDGLVASIRA